MPHGVVRFYQRNNEYADRSSAFNGLLTQPNKRQDVFFHNFMRQLLHKKTAKAKVVHFMHDDKFNADIALFFQKNFEPETHIVLCRRLMNHPAIPFPDGSHVIEIEDYSDIDAFDLADKKLLFHGLFDRMMIDFLYDHKTLLANSYWMIWGADMYESIDDEKALFVKKNFSNYLIEAPGEKDFFIDKFGKVPGKFKHIKYSFISYDTDLWDKCKSQVKEKNYTLIQVNHSCSVENLEMLDMLSKFKSENIRIRCILSYGNRMDCKDLIKNKGHKIFGDRFECFEQFLSKEDYFAKLAEVDVLVLNQNRQQGMGNTYIALYYGTKVFIRNDISTFEKFNQDFIVYDTHTIPELDYKAFLHNDNDDNKDKMKAHNRLVKGMWEELLQ
jgi:hypothetical protein